MFIKTEKSYHQASDTKTTKHSPIMISGVILYDISSLVNFSSELCNSVIFKSHLFITFTHSQAPDCQHSEQMITNSFFHDIPHPIHPHRVNFSLISNPNLLSVSLASPADVLRVNIPFIFLKVRSVGRKI